MHLVKFPLAIIPSKGKSYYQRVSEFIKISDPVNGPVAQICAFSH